MNTTGGQQDISRFVSDLTNIQNSSFVLSERTTFRVSVNSERSSKYTTPPVKMIDDRWAGLPV